MTDAHEVPPQSPPTETDGCGYYFDYVQKIDEFTREASNNLGDYSHKGYALDQYRNLLTHVAQTVKAGQFYAGMSQVMYGLFTDPNEICSPSFAIGDGGLSFTTGVSKMLKRSITVVTCGTLLAAGLVSPVFAAPQDFVGNWVNVNSNTRGITRFVVTAPQPNTLKVQVFGKCHPTDCAWGVTQFTTYGSTVQDSNHKEATAVYNQSFANDFLTFALRGANRMLLQSFTQFTDHSARQNYFAQEQFKRS